MSVSSPPGTVAPPQSVPFLFTLHRSQERGLFHHHPENPKLPPRCVTLPIPLPVCPSAQPLTTRTTLGPPPSLVQARAFSYSAQRAPPRLVAPPHPAPLCPRPAPPRFAPPTKANPCFLTLWLYVALSITVWSSLLAYVLPRVSSRPSLVGM